MNTDPGNSFFANSLEPGVFSGISGGTHFNRGCSSHSPSSGTDDEGDVAAARKLRQMNNPD